MYNLSDFDFNLPSQLIAQHPISKRDSSRLLLLDRSSKIIEHHKFFNVVDSLHKGDLLVLNDTKVMPARLIGRRSTGGRVEILLLRQASEAGKNSYNALIKPLGRLKDGEEIFFSQGFSCRLLDAKAKIVEFKNGEPKKIIKKIGLLPLPPYIQRELVASDNNRYQTVFAKKEGAVAAPTAGLHFTKKLLLDIKKKGVEVAFLTLHVNYATFSPVRCEDIRQHKMTEEYFHISASTVKLICKAKQDGRRVIAVGTTVCKALEDGWAIMQQKIPGNGITKWSNLFIYPPFHFKVADALITNFHLSGTSLLMLVSAFAGKDFILKAYNEAVSQNYRFYSYGDAMMIT